MTTETALRRMIDMSNKEKNNCRNCTGLGACKNSVKGRCQKIIIAYDDEVPLLSDFYCKYFRAKRDSDKKQAEINHSNIGKRYLGETFDTFCPDDNPHALKTAREYAHTFTNHTQTGIMFKGGTGTGKTHLAAAILLELKERGFEPYYISVSEAASLYSSSWQHNDTREINCTLCYSQLLILDDLGKEKSSDSVREFMFQIINLLYVGLM